MSIDEFLEGVIAVEAALESRFREIRQIYIHADRLDTRIAAIQKLARQRAIPYERLPADEYQTLVPGEQSGGIVARVGPRRLVSLDELLSISPVPAILMLDGVEDPYNFGQAIRAIYAAGIDGLVVQSRSWLQATAIIARASAGASERIPIANVKSSEEAAEFFRAAGLSIACATATHSLPMTEVDLTQPLFLVIGGEKRGISRSLLKNADLRVTIPYGRDFHQDLGSATAAAVLGFEILRQRRASYSFS